MSAVGRGGPPGRSDLSFAVLAVAVAGVATTVLGITAVLVVVLDVSPAVKIGIVVTGLVLAVAAMADASRRVTARAIRNAHGGDDRDPGDVEDPATH